MERPTRGYPLRTLLLWLVVALIVPVLLLVVLSVQRVNADARGTAERRLIEEARELIRAVDTELDASVRTLQVLAESPSLRTGDVPAFTQVAANFLRSHPTWDRIVLTAADGRHIATTGAQADPIEVDDGFRAVVATAQPGVANIRRGPDGAFGVPVRTPVVVDGEVTYVLAAVIAPDRLAGVLPLGNDDTWLRVVMDATNTIVARTRLADRFVGSAANEAFVARIRDQHEVMFESVTLDGEEVYSGVSRGVRSGWRAVVAAPRSVVDADLRRTMMLLGVSGALLIGVGGIGALVIARRIARDMSMATDAAAALVSGRRVDLGTPDVLEIRQLSEALTRSAELLRVREEERDARVKQADAARAEAEAAMRAKDEFLAMLGHELRNPLAPVLNALHVAQASGGVLGERERGVVERQVRHMARLVDDLLDMSRLHFGNIDLHLESCNLQAIVAEAVEMTRSRFESQQQRLSVDVPADVFIECDAHRITQVIVNLLNNAAKYTAPGGEVRLSARIDTDDVILSCEDNGIGLAPDLLDRVFEPFVQGTRGIDRRQGGLGLGLAVVRSLVERHGGSVSASSQGEGSGSRFDVRLPLRRVPADRPGPAPAVRPVRAGVKVLVVEDNDDVREMLVLALSMSGVDVRGAASADEALLAVDEWRPEAAVLDIGLPDVDGFELARALRQRLDGHRIFLMALTGYGGDVYAGQARAAGFDAFFVKPVGVDVLLDTIANLQGDGA